MFHETCLYRVQGIVPYAGISFWTFETLKSVLSASDREGDRTGPGHRLVIGACAGLIAQSVTYPLETIRRRIQVVPDSGRPSLIGLATDIYRREGVVGGLYKGLSMNWVKGPVATGLSFAVYDLVKTALRPD